MQKDYSTARAECMCKIVKAKKTTTVEWNLSYFEISIFV